MEMEKVLELLVPLLGRHNLHILLMTLIVRPSYTESSDPGKTQVCVTNGREERTRKRQREK